jgi:hypothetical protein
MRPGTRFARPESFLKGAIAAFPSSCRGAAKQAANTLAPHVDEDYRLSSLQVFLLGESIWIPKRIHFVGLDGGSKTSAERPWVAIQCLCTRSTDGYIRHASLRQILMNDEPWVIPFVVLLAGEYVVEIVEDIAASATNFDRVAYADFVRQNRDLMRLLRSRATSYWNRHYRHAYPDRSTYPGLALLHELEFWAS